EETRADARLTLVPASLAKGLEYDYVVLGEPGVAGSRSCRRASTILITAAAPAAACVCPRLDFTDPSHSGRPSGRSRP
ncbi:hypothetical protein ACWEP3_29700, partial [Streptomyces albidoflavus]